MKSFLERYNYREREEFWQKYWEQNGIFKFAENSDKPIYIIDTPPPYVSAAHLHAGHIMSYAQAEFIARYKRMNGYNVYYPMGFDDNGLPTERYVEKKYNIDKSTTSREEFIKLCLKETAEGAKNYEWLWKSMGISVDWRLTYSTINSTCTRVSQWSFCDLFRKGKIYRKDEPILWCTTCQTALAQADLEDVEIETSLSYIDFLVEGKKYQIATTRPELLGACVGLFANPKDKRYSDLEGKEAEVPLFKHRVKIYFDETVNMEFGTGLMMVCSWGDTEDIRRWKNFNLNTRKFIDEKGIVTDLGGKYAGVKLSELRDVVVADLKSEGMLVKQEPISHIVNSHERCGTPVEFVQTKQWFIDVLNVKGQLLKLGNELNWYPKFMKQRYVTWVNGLKWDWCISRQRFYGVPIPVWFVKETGEALIPEDSELPVDPTNGKIPASILKKYRTEELVPEQDVLDTWATSSCTPIIIPELEQNETVKAKLFPASLRPQGFEIIRTWLFYTLVKSFYHFGKVPFVDVMISGNGQDDQGRKISKRLGNYIEPPKLLEQYGADALRYWATGATLGKNHRFKPEEVEKGKFTANKLFNASRFCYSQIIDFKPNLDRSKRYDGYKLEPEDKWIFNELRKTIRKTRKFFDRYEYAKARTSLDKFFWRKFSDYYIEIVKHRTAEDSAKYTLYTVLNGIVKLYAPILAFVTEEIYQSIYAEDEGIKSVHICNYPVAKEEWKLSREELTEFELFLKEIDCIRKEKTEKGYTYKQVLEGYKPKTSVNVAKFGKKLEQMLYVTLEY